MIEAWLPTAVSAAALGIVVWFIRMANAKLQEQVEKLETRLTGDEKSYLTRESHKEICNGNSAQLMLHMNKLMNALRMDLDAKNKEIWDYLREIRDMIKNGNGKNI